MSEDPAHEIITGRDSESEIDSETESLIFDHEVLDGDEEGFEDVDEELEEQQQQRFKKVHDFRPTTKLFHEPQSFLAECFEEGSTYFELLRQFFTDEIVEIIVVESNRFATQIKENHNSLKNWMPLTKEDFWQFLALTMLMGIIKKPAIKDYWSEEKQTESPFFRDVMSRNRYTDILRALHFVDNTTVPATNENRFIKLGEVMPKILNKFKTAIRPGVSLCLDESLLPFHGRLSFRQYNAMKRGRFGIKSFVLCDAKTNFVIDVLPYQGKATNIGSQDWIRQYGFGGAAVLTLLQDYLNKGHRLTIDNWFMSPALANTLYVKDTYVLGTVQKRRKGMPKFNGKLNKGAIELYSNGTVLLERWMDRREVIIMNTYMAHGMQQSESRNPFNTRMKPNSVIEYNKTMGSLDAVDRTIRTYQSVRKSYKWYKKFFFNLLDMALYNTLVVHRSLHPRSRRLSYKEYLLKLTDEIFTEFPYEKRNRRTAPVTSDHARLTGQHLPLRVEKNGNVVYSSCTLCNSRGNRKTTSFRCSTCLKWLCINEERQCFFVYHTIPSIPKKRVRQALVNDEMDQDISESLLAAELVNTADTTEAEESASVSLLEQDNSMIFEF